MIATVQRELQPPTKTHHELEQTQRRTGKKKLAAAEGNAHVDEPYGRRPIYAGDLLEGLNGLKRKNGRDPRQLQRPCRPARSIPSGWLM